MIGAVLLTPLQRPGLHSLIPWISGRPRVQCRTEFDGHATLYRAETDRQIDRLARVADSVEAVVTPGCQSSGGA
jgi:hypothetical protein